VKEKGFFKENCNPGTYS